MIDDASPSLHTTWPLPAAPLAVHNELPMPTGMVRAAVQCIVRFCQPAVRVFPLQPLITHVDRSSEHGDRLFALRGFVADHHHVVSSAHRHPVRQPIAVLLEHIGQICEATVASCRFAENMQRCLRFGRADERRSRRLLGVSSAESLDTTS